MANAKAKKSVPAKRMNGYREQSSQYPTMHRIWDAHGGYKVELIGDVSYIRYPTENFNGHNVQLQFPNKEPNFWVDAQVWESATEAVSGEVIIIPEEGDPIVEKKHEGIRVGDRIKVTGYAQLSDPLRRSDGTLVKHGKQLVKQLRIRVNYPDQIKVVRRVRGFSSNQNADATKRSEAAMPDGVF